MERIPVSSNNVASVGFDPQAGELEVEFSSGGVYVYSGVSPEEYDALLKSPSVGRHLHAVIKPAHSASRV